MKIALSVEALAPQLTGIGRYTWELASRLPSHPQVEAVGFFRNGEQILSPADLLVPSQARPWVGRVWSRSIQQWKVRCWLRERIFHGPNYFLPVNTANGIITLHDLSVLRYPETHPVERLRQFEARLLSSIEMAHHIITDSESVRREVITEFGRSEESVTSIPLGVSPSFQPRSPAEIADTLNHFNLKANGYTLCVSTIEPRKRIDRLLAAYGTLDALTHSRFPLVLVGGAGWLDKDINSRIEVAKHAGWLKQLGFVDETTLPALYAGARLFAFPSLYEGFGLPVLEAMASGTPVIAANCSSIPEVAGGFALLIDPDDVTSFGNALQRGLYDDAWRDAVSKSGIARASHFTWEACVERTTAVYRHVHQARGL